MKRSSALVARHVARASHGQARGHRRCGTCGLGCADILVRNGVEPVVFDRYQRIGGLLTFGIPPFKLEKEVVEKRREVMQGMVSNFSWARKWEPTFRSSGCSMTSMQCSWNGYVQSVQGGFPGEDLSGVYEALPYLISNVNHELALTGSADKLISLRGQRVMVLGGGDTGMDCNRTAVRQARPSLAARIVATKPTCPARAATTRTAKRRASSSCSIASRSRLSVRNASRASSSWPRGWGRRVRGRRIPEPIPGSEEVVAADAVIIAFGFLRARPLVPKTRHPRACRWARTRVCSPGTPFQTTNPKYSQGAIWCEGRISS